ncbi:putative Golgin A3 protein [Naja naja]|nr:putative Golgin A3 protein [Naja naja]
MQELESQLQLAQKERNDMEAELQSLRFDQEQMSALVKVNKDLKQQVDEMQQETKMAITEQKQKMKRLGSDLSTAQKEMKAKHKAYENAVGVLSRRLQEALAAKESSEAELNELKAQFSESENNQASLERIRALEAELQSLTHSPGGSEKQRRRRSKDEAADSDFANGFGERKANVLTLKEQGRRRKALRGSLSDPAELVGRRSQLQLLQKQLDDQLDKQPVENQELEDLKWEVEQKERELQALKQQLDLTEQRSQKELEGVQLVLQKDKFMLQAKMSELKNSIKTLLQQNQQLKLDLKQGKMKKGETGSNPVTPVKIPDCPVPAALLEELLKPPSAVSKEPLRNLNSCLQQLRLQRQMEEHTVTVHESMSSWTQIEGQLTDLTTNLSVTLLANESLPHRDLQDHKPTDAQEEVTQ